MTYEVAEKFKSIQGEGVYAGTPMAFIRFTGCSVGKRICQHCDTDFDSQMPWRGGGAFTVDDLLAWAHPYRHVCLTGGEPFDQDLEPLFRHAAKQTWLHYLHVETSGTKSTFVAGLVRSSQWICVSPKPGFIESVVLAADEVKVIVPGLGEISGKSTSHWITLPDPAQPGVGGELKRWPDLSDALRWTAAGKIVFLQPRNAKYDIDQTNLRLCQDIIAEHPELRLSVQMHKILRVQ